MDEMTAWIAVAIFVAAYIAIATEWIHKTRAALIGAGLVVGLGVVGADEVFYSHDTGIDWNVIFLLLGMMVIVSVLRRTGVFEFTAIWSAKRAKGSPLRVMILLVLITAVASAMLDNVTTVLLIAPVTILVCERLGLNPIPFLMAEVFASNIGGAATLIGDPPNIIIASRSGLTFNDFLVHMLPIVVVEMIVFIVILPWLFRGSFDSDPDRVAEVMELNEREAIEDTGLLIKCGVVLLAVFAGFVGHAALHVEPSIVALLGAGVLVLISRSTPEQYLASVEWETLLFFAGLFIMVGALIHTGVIGDLADLVAEATGGDALRGVGTDPRCVGGDVRHHRQHPVRGDDEPAGGPAGRGHRRPRTGPGAVVVAGPRCGLRWQPHRRRCQRQRRGARHRLPQRHADLVLGVHARRASWSPRSRSRSPPRTSGCATSPSPSAVTPTRWCREACW